MTALMRQRWTRSCAADCTPVNTKTTARHQYGDKLLTFIKDL